MFISGGKSVILIINNLITPDLGFMGDIEKRNTFYEQLIQPTLIFNQWNVCLMCNKMQQPWCATRHHWNKVTVQWPELKLHYNSFSNISFYT